MTKDRNLVTVIIEDYIPTGPLAEFVETIHFISGHRMGTGIAFPRMQQVIIINLGGRFLSSDIYSLTAPVRETESSVWMNGKQDDPFLLGNPGVTSMYAIALKLGTLPFFASLPAIETSNRALGAEHWTSPEIFSLQQRLLACASVREGFLLIERYLLDLLAANRDFSSLDKIKWLGRAIYTHPVEEICRILGVTRKRLRTEAQHCFGGSVKNIQGIIRLNRTLRTIATAAAENSDRSLSSLHEYFDQAHFIHDFKNRTGMTPLQYRRLCQQYPFIARTPNFIALPRETFIQFISRVPL
jgi:AraC-like DNA-binding protein